MKSKFYKVTCKDGHVGKGFFIRIDYAINANSRKEASAIARRFPRVKHNHKDAIIDCVEISYEEYLEILDKNRNDPYLKCRSPQEQAQILNLKERIEAEPQPKAKQENKRDVVCFKNKKRDLREQSYIDYQLDLESCLFDEEALAF